MKKIIKELNELEITYKNSKLKFKIGDKYNKLTITDWSRETGLSWNTINSRLKKGLTVGQALGYEI